jgi:NADPH:quinone reductase
MSGDAWRMIVRAHGGPEAIERERFDPGTPGAGEVLIAQDAVGLNFIDTYYRTGLYPAPLPLTLGSEGAGHVVAVGAGVSGIAVGARSAALRAWAPMQPTASSRPIGSYASPMQSARAMPPQ